MASVESYKKRRPGGFARSIVRRRRNIEAAQRALEELTAFTMGGEPSANFYPPPRTEGRVIFLADRPKKRVVKDEPDIATAQDIRDRIREQNERIVWQEHDLGNPAFLPPPVISYMVRHWDEIQALKARRGCLASAESSLPLGKIS